MNKGTALIELARSLGVVRDNDLVGSLLYAGDDRTDEDAFRALPPPPSNAITVHVGRAELPEGFRTHAEFVADDPIAVQELLQWLVSVREQALTPRT
jgi:trehalose-6-phosphatase